MTQTYSGGCQCDKVRRCVDGVDVDSLKVKKVDGRHLQSACP
jgi:hypothetical protein